ncbi:MAG: hypothetical protein ABI614_27570 [Planctomycetota bacterium]
MGAGATGVGAVAVTVSTEVADTVVEAAASAALGVDVIIPVSPVDIVQDLGKLGFKKGLKKAVTGSVNCFVAGTLVEMDDTVEATDEAASNDFTIAAVCLPIALAGYSISRRKKKVNHAHAAVDAFFGELDEELRHDRI